MSQTDQVIHWIDQLPLRERLHIVEHILDDLARQFPSEAKATPLRSLYGLWRGFTITDEDITQARREMWGTLAEKEL